MSAERREGELLNGRNLKYIGIFLSISFLSMAGMNLSPALQQIAVAFPEQSSEAVQSLVTLPSLFIVFTSFLSGPLSSLISKKRTILLGSLIFIVSGCMPYIFSQSFALIRVSRILIGCGLGIMQPLSSSIMFSVFTNPNHRNTVIGWSSCGTAIGSIIATNLAGVLAAIDYRFAFLVHLLGLVTFFVCLFFLPQDSIERQDGEGRASLSDKVKTFIGGIRPSIVIWFLLMFLYMGFLNAFSTKISILVEGDGIGSPSVSALGISLLTVGSFVGSFFYGQISKLLKKFTMVIGITISAVGLFLLSVAQSHLPVYLSGLLTGLGMSMTTPGILINVVNLCNEMSRTLVIAFNSAMSNLGLSLSPYMTAWATMLFFGSGRSIRNEYLVSAATLLLLGACVFIGSICFSFVKRNGNK